jgi:hypothetical protein
VTNDGGEVADPGADNRAEGLIAELGVLGLECSVEGRGGLAVIRAEPRVARQLADPLLRRRILALARGHGFTHIAVAIGDG